MTQTTVAERGNGNVFAPGRVSISAAWTSAGGIVLFVAMGAPVAVFYAMFGVSIAEVGIDYFGLLTQAFLGALTLMVIIGLVGAVGLAVRALSRSSQTSGPL